MADIFSKRDDPRPEDVRAKRLIAENAGTIRKLADQISNGGFTKMRQDQKRRKEEPKPDGLLIYSMSATPRADDDPDPYIRLSLNGRVVVADQSSGRQIQMLGEIRSKSGSKRFVIASEENGFISPVSARIHELLARYDNIELTAEFTETDLVQTLAECLGLADKVHVNQGDSDMPAEKRQGTAEDDSSELL